MGPHRPTYSRGKGNECASSLPSFFSLYRQSHSRLVSPSGLCLTLPTRLIFRWSSRLRAPAVIIHGEDLLAFPGRQTITVEGGTSARVPRTEGVGFENRSTDRVFVAYGRTIDVMAWLSPARHTLLGVDAVNNTLTALPRSGELYLPEPAGSDLWFAEYSESDSVSISIAAPDDVSVLIMSDGVLPAPHTVTISWPVTNEAPWILALIVVGLVTMVAGFIALITSWIHWRRTKGPRRRKTRRPKVRAPRVSRVKRPSSVRPRGRAEPHNSSLCRLPQLSPWVDVPPARPHQSPKKRPRHRPTLKQLRPTLQSPSSSFPASWRALRSRFDSPMRNSPSTPWA